MIAISSGLKVLIATKPVDCRKGMDGLAALVKAHLGPIRSRGRFLCSVPSAPIESS
jgi:hypothetical protein